ncbi:MAG: FAD-binding protein [Alphaproteobacteria bacterium]|nr:FAD-binding protein [Alphaproteobacteria bacterium]
MREAAQSGAARRADVVIAGGGLVGLSLGIALAKAGLDVVVADTEKPETRRAQAFDGRVSSIAQGSKRVLEGIGLWPGMAPEAEPILEIRVSDGDAPLFLHYDHKQVGTEPLGYIVENRVTRNAQLDLIARLPTLEHRAPCKVTALTPEPGGVVATLSDGGAVRASLAVIAEGRESPLREAAGIGVTRWRYEQSGIVCTVAHERPHRGIAHERFLPAGPFAILPMTGNRSSIVWTEREVLVPGLLALPEGRFLVELKRRFGDFLGALEVVGSRRSYPIALCHARRYVAERIALVGDSAHGIHPIAGQGLNLGIRDVAALAEIIVDHRRLGLDVGGRDVLARYERWRRFDSTVMIAVTDSLNRLFSNDLAPVQLARDLGLAAVNRVPRLKRLFMRHAMGTVGDLPRLARGEKL